MLSKSKSGRLCLSSDHLFIVCLLIRYDSYSFSVIPALGELVAGDRDSYQYLVESVRRFPPQVYVSTITNIVCDFKF